jgi:hypothetical protein
VRCLSSAIISKGPGGQIQALKSAKGDVHVAEVAQNCHGAHSDYRARRCVYSHRRGCAGRLGRPRLGLGRRWLGQSRLGRRRLGRQLRLLLSSLGSAASAAVLLLRRLEQRRLEQRPLEQRRLERRRLGWRWLGWLVICGSKKLTAVEISFIDRPQRAVEPCHQ